MSITCQIFKQIEDIMSLMNKELVSDITDKLLLKIENGNKDYLLVFIILLYSLMLFIFL